MVERHDTVERHASGMPDTDATSAHATSADAAAPDAASAHEAASEGSTLSPAAPLWLEKARRRARVYPGRVARMATGRSLRAPCAFMHVPKCGGTSLAEALYALVPLHRGIGVIDAVSARRALAIQYAGTDDRTTYHDEGERADDIAAFRESLLLMHMAHGAALVHGHFLFSEIAQARFGDRYRFVTLLRDPIARTLSNWRMARRNGVVEGDLDAFLDSGMGRRMAQHALRYFSGTATVTPGEEAALLTRAKMNMAHFAVIGFIEEPDAFSDRFETVFGARPAIGHANRGDGHAPDLTPTQRAKLEALCAPDIELGEHARKLDCCARPRRRSAAPPSDGRGGARGGVLGPVPDHGTSRSGTGERGGSAIAARKAFGWGVFGTPAFGAAGSTS